MIAETTSIVAFEWTAAWYSTGLASHGLLASTLSGKRKGHEILDKIVDGFDFLVLIGSFVKQSMYTSLMYIEFQNG